MTKQIDCIMGTRDLKFKTWYLNKVRLRAWDHYPVVGKVEGKEVRQVQGKEGWAGWVPNTEEERQKFKTRVLRPEGPRVCMDSGQDGRREGERFLAGKAGGGGHDD